MALVITEEWIRERVQLNHDNLEDVKSLALPGTYHEKITELSNSVRNFTRLKNLDLSRNSLISLNGLNHLKMLEKLNLYYNSIETLRDLFKLRHNPSLKEIDLRLNPVTKNEPDYRLFVIHMLPNLKKLDDRSVRDMERKAALTHFSSEQANQFNETFSPRETAPQQTDDVTPNVRVESVRKMATIPSVLENDDCRMMDDIARVNGALELPRPITGSNLKEPSTMEYNRDVIYEMEKVDAIKAGELTYQNNLSQMSQQHCTPVENYQEPRQFTVSSMPINGQELCQQGNRATTAYNGLSTQYPGVAGASATISITTNNTDNNATLPPYYNTQSTNTSSPDGVNTHRNNFGPYNNLKAAEIQQRPSAFSTDITHDPVHNNIVDHSMTNNQQQEIVNNVPSNMTTTEHQEMLSMQQQQLMYKMAASQQPQAQQQKTTNNGIPSKMKSRRKKGDKMKVRFYEERHDAVLNDNIASHLIMKDESAAYNAYQSIATFTPNPGHTASSDYQPAIHGNNITKSDYNQLPLSSSSNNSTPRDLNNSSPSSSSTSSSSTDELLDFPKPSFELNTRSNEDNKLINPGSNSNTNGLAASINNIAVTQPTNTGDPVLEKSDIPVPLIPANDKIFLDKLCNLVDKYWNGSKSLHSHLKFQALAHKVVVDYGPSLVSRDSEPSTENEITQLRRDITAFADENISLRQQLRVQDTTPTVDGRAECEKLKTDLQTVNSENLHLREQINFLKSESKTNSQSQDAGELMKKDNIKYKSELDSLKTQLKQYLRVEEMARLLQESHSSLVATNEQLLRELNDTRHRHQKEVEQLNWNYEQLRQTVSLVPHNSNSNREYTNSNPNREYTNSNPNREYTNSNPNREYTNSNPNREYTNSNPNREYTNSNPNREYTNSNPNRDYSPSSSLNDQRPVAMRSHHSAHTTDYSSTARDMYDYHIPVKPQSTKSHKTSNDNNAYKYLYGGEA